MPLSIVCFNIKPKGGLLYACIGFLGRVKKNWVKRDNLKVMSLNQELLNNVDYNLAHYFYQLYSLLQNSVVIVS